MKKRKQTKVTKSKAERFLLIHAILPILIGALLYYILSPDVLFVKQIDMFVGGGIHFPSLMEEYGIVQLIRNYGMDVLWGYSLLYAMCLILDNNTAKRWKIFIIAFSFSVIMELLQLTPFVKGTFDIWDIIIEAFSEGTAVFIINYKLRGGNSNEKET